MGSLNAASVTASATASDEHRFAADLLWQMKAIATKEVTSSISNNTKKQRKTSFSGLGLPRIISTTPSIASDVVSLDESSDVYDLSYSPEAAIRRMRTVSVGSADKILSNDDDHTHDHTDDHAVTAGPPELLPPSSTTTRMLIKLSPRPAKMNNTDASAENLEHFDWSNIGSPANKNHYPSSPLLLVGSSSPPSDLLKQSKNSKRKREGFLGTATKQNVAVRGTLRKKFSWKQYPELEEYLLANQDEYFEYSSKNYTAEQRKYNNGLTRGLLDLAAEEGYIFEDFTFSMIRDRIRCYYKSHSQLAKKKRHK
jgi:hypothetical protein